MSSIKNLDEIKFRIEKVKEKLEWNEKEVKGLKNNLDDLEENIKVINNNIDILENFKGVISKFIKNKMLIPFFITLIISSGISFVPFMMHSQLFLGGLALLGSLSLSTFVSVLANYKELRHIIDVKKDGNLDKEIEFKNTYLNVKKMKSDWLVEALEYGEKLQEKLEKYYDLEQKELTKEVEKANECMDYIDFSNKGPLNGPKLVRSKNKK